ncbi:hypothetical protein, partial [Bradyrhizobium guangzhouense]|uniref:hypothetical protein n=1 Tax=Bradyrhizobium guangzhouense TaxID=1325095 RepID=UPI0019D6BB16
SRNALPRAACVPASRARRAAMRQSAGRHGRRGGDRTPALSRATRVAGLRVLIAFQIARKFVEIDRDVRCNDATKTS